jgi:hypothetical protein
MEMATTSSFRASLVGNQGPAASRSPKRSTRATTLTALERRISELEYLASSQSHELRIQFERIAQLQADCDVLRIRSVKP